MDLKFLNERAANCEELQIRRTSARLSSTVQDIIIKGGDRMFRAYHGVTGAQHQASFNSLSAQGFRMISLSVYGDPGDARYAAVWVQRPGPAWVAVHGVDSAGYQSFFNNWTAKGFVPVRVSATGTSSNA